MAPRSRAPLFAAISAVLIAAALLLGGRSSTHQPEPTPSMIGSASARHLGPAPSRAGLAATARRFLGAFLLYEVGDLESQVERALRATTTPAFAAELLDEPPRPSSLTGSSRATLGRLSFLTVSGDPPLVSVSGTARRPGGPEQLSFLFVFHRGRWLASAPGE